VKEAEDTCEEEVEGRGGRERWEREEDSSEKGGDVHVVER